MADDERVKECRDFYERLGWVTEPGYLASECCESCHEEANEGYEPLQFEIEGEDCAVCCAVDRALGAVD